MQGMEMNVCCVHRLQPPSPRTIRHRLGPTGGPDQTFKPSRDRGNQYGRPTMELRRMQQTLAVHWAPNRTSLTAYKVRNKKETGIRHIVRLPTRGIARRNDFASQKCNMTQAYEVFRTMNISNMISWCVTPYYLVESYGARFQATVRRPIFCIAEVKKSLFLFKKFTEELHPFLQARQQNCLEWLLATSCLSVCLSVCLYVRPSSQKNSVPTGRISLKFGIC